MSLYVPSSQDLNWSYFVDATVTNSDPPTYESCVIVPTSPELGYQDCPLPTEFASSYTTDFAAAAAGAIAGANAFTGPGVSVDWLAFALKVDTDTLGGATGGCDPVNGGCAPGDPAQKYSHMVITGATWYPNDYDVTTNWYGVAAGVTPTYPTQQYTNYSMQFGSPETYVRNPSPTYPVPDSYGNEFGAVLFPAGTVPSDVTVAFSAKGVSMPDMRITVSAYAFHDKRATTTPPTPPLLCVL